ncbi:unnamed protein product [Schistosoma margrebowiei]|uniref:Uncharacterized protein n=1 Tax=Schistosoma margrebowiei TaxID=48269 RepID=A0A183LVC1_9TREM|nr:unnamed protein product [Schistosoma margrebowiei]
MKDQLDAGINIPNQERELLQMPRHSFQDARTACISYEAVHLVILQVINNPNTLLSYPNLMSTQVRTDIRLITDYPYPCENTDNVSVYRLGKYLSCDKFLLHDSRTFRHAKCFKCNKMRHIKSICKTTARYAINNTDICKSDPMNLDDSSKRTLPLLFTSSNALHFQTRMYLPNVAIHDFIVDTVRFKSTISVGRLKSLKHDAITKPSKVSISIITSRKPSILGCYNLKSHYYLHHLVAS